MVLKSISLAVNDYCNNRCIMCNIWKNKWKNKMSVIDYEKLFEKREFGKVEEISISGGEPLLRKDLFKITDIIISKTPMLKQIFLNTNGTFPSKTKNFIKKYAKKVKMLYLCIPIEGNKKIHKKVRGVDSYDQVINTIKLCKDLPFKNVRVIISTTLVSINSSRDNLSYIKELAKSLKCGWTFRLAGKSESYYLNQKLKKSLKISGGKIKQIIKFIKKFCMRDPFMRFQKKFLEEGRFSFKCSAGDTFVFIQADGKIYPCIFSVRVIGNKNKGLFRKEIKDLGKFETCPCCTECTFYPIFNFDKKFKYIA